MRVRKRRLIPVTVHQRFQLIDIGQAPGLIERQRGIQFREAVQGGFPVHSIFQVFQATWPIPDQARQWVETPSAPSQNALTAMQHPIGSPSWPVPTQALALPSVA